MDREIFKITWKDYIFIGVFMVACYVGTLAGYTIMSQYIYYRIEIEKGGLTLNYSFCDDRRPTNSQIHNEVQSLAAQYNIYAQLASGIPSIVVVLFSGAISDLFGRKKTICLSLIGLSLGNIFNICLVVWDAPLWVYILGQFISGFGGSYGAMLSGVLSLVSDSTDHSRRNYGIVIIEFTLGVSMIVSQALLGIWLKYKQFLWPVVAFSCLQFASYIPFCFIKETRQNNLKVECSNIKNFFSVSLKKLIGFFLLHSKLNVLLNISLICFFLHTFNFFGNLTVITVYLFGRPFCWNSEILGYYRSSSAAVVQVGMFLSLFILKCHNDEIMMIDIGFVTFILSKLLFGIAAAFNKSIADILIFIAAADLFSGASVSLLRSTSSKLVPRDDYGLVFAVMSSIETIASLLGGVVFNSIYDATLSTFYGSIYIISALSLFGALILMIIFSVLKRKSNFHQYDCLGL